MTWSIEDTFEADVNSADVFRYYAEPSTWGAWAHNTAWGKGHAPLELGSTVEVRVRSYPWTYTVTVRALIPGRTMVTEVRPFGVVITSTYEVVPTAGGARLHHTIALRGPLERGYRLVRGPYMRMLHAETRRVAELAASGQAPLASGTGAPSTIGA
jgi:Polyketide cyclase / dehydrase and lipid transport